MVFILLFAVVKFKKQIRQVQLIIIFRRNMRPIRKIITLFIPLVLILNACVPAVSTKTATGTDTKIATEQFELQELKGYVIDHARELHDSILDLKTASDQYYALAGTYNFDYQAMWKDQSQAVMELISKARTAFLAANPKYEQMEGVIAGVPSLSQFDLILDAGVAGSSGGEDTVPFNLSLPNGTLLEKPGNLFEVTESTLWGTDPGYIVAGIHPDFNQNNSVDLGDALPDANVLKGTVDTFEQYTAELEEAAKIWQPTQVEAFGALLSNVPTFTDFMEGWKNSRFVRGDASTERGFVATSRLSDLRDNIQSWQKIYEGLSPSVQKVASQQDTQIIRDLENLQAFVSDIYAQESIQGKQFTPEEADMLSAEGQSLASSITGQLAQVAAKLQISIEE
jgi:hypothetical protein